MPRPKKRSIELEVVELDRRAREARLKLLTTKLQTVIKNKPSLVPDLWQKCLSLGVTDENINDVEAFVEKSKQMQARCAASLNAKKEEAADDGEAVAEIDAIPPKVTYLCDCTVAMFRDRFLPSIEPSALSMANCRSHERAIGGKKGLMEIFEFASGLQADYVLKDVFHSVQEFLDMAIERAQARGRRCRDLSLPPCWESDGLFSVVGVCKTTRTVKLKQIFTQEVLAVPIGAAAWTFYSDPKYIDVLCNYSEIKATLWSKRDAKHAHTVSLAGHFRGGAAADKGLQPAVSPPRKRPKVEADSEEVDGARCEDPMIATPVAAVAGLAGSGTLPLETGGDAEHCQETDVATPAKVKFEFTEAKPSSFDETKLEVPSPAR
eukprot:6491329-Amphidinium_carterae.1